MKEISCCFTTGHHTTVSDPATTESQYNGISRTSLTQTLRDIPVIRLSAAVRGRYGQWELDIVIIHR